MRGRPLCCVRGQRKGPRGQGMQQPLEAGNGQESDLEPGPSPPGCQPRDTQARLLTSRTVRESVCVVLSH